MKMSYLGVSILLALGQSTTAPIRPAPAGAPSQQGAARETPTNVTTPSDPKQRMDLAKKVNGLLNLDIPWHLKATYEVFGADGKSADTGTFEEWRSNASQYRIALHSPSISAEEFGTDHGVFRTGEQGWPRKPLSLIPSMIARPIPSPFNPEKIRLENYERTFGGAKVPCTALIYPGWNLAAQDAEGYCFATTNAILLYATERDRPVQTLFQQNALVHGHYFAHDMQLLLEGKPWLKVHIDQLEGLSPTGQQALTVPAGASPVTRYASAAADITAGRLVKKEVPVYPLAAKQLGVQGTVILEGVVDTEGHVQQLQVLAGPPMLQQAAIDAAKQWVYTPYSLAGKPVEVEIEINVAFALPR
jgi:TonB family protein